MNRCTDTPISWWTLERYHIGEISPSEHAEVATHLETCPNCRTRLDSIIEDRRPLPVLALAAPRPADHRPWQGVLGRRTTAAILGAAVAIACVLGWPLLTDAPSQGPAGGGVAERGGDPVLTIIRERDGVVVENPRRYAPGDRFRLELTLPGAEPRGWDAAVFQGREVYFPSKNDAPVEPGNHVVLPGGFRVTGSMPVTICVMLGPDLPERSQLKRDGPEALPKSAICQTLTTEAGSAPDSALE